MLPFVVMLLLGGLNVALATHARLVASHGAAQAGLYAALMPAADELDAGNAAGEYGPAAVQSILDAGADCIVWRVAAAGVDVDSTSVTISRPEADQWRITVRTTFAPIGPVSLGSFDVAASTVARRLPAT